MPYRQNPFYQYANPGMGQAFEGLAATLFPGGKDALNTAHAENYAANADMSRAHAGKYREETRGLRDKNDAVMTAPSTLAELILGGGVLRDDQLKRNPDYKEPAPIDWNNVLTQKIEPASSAPMFLPYATSQEKMARAIQEADIRGMKLEDVLKAAGQAEYLRRMAGDKPDSALGYAPFVGVHAPNTQTALTTGRQDAISSRDSGEAKSLEGVRQAGADRRNKYSVDNKPITAGNNTDTIVTPTQGKAMGIEPNENGQYVVRGRATLGTGQIQKPGSLGGDAVEGREKTTPGSGVNKTSAVPVAASNKMQSIIEAQMKEQGITVSPETVSGLLAEAGNVWQTNKNPAAAADDVIQRLRGGETVNGVSINTESRMLRSDKKTLQRQPGAGGGANADAIAKARDAINKGANRAAVIKRLKDNGIEPVGL
jgi:hypothetical protein